MASVRSRDTKPELALRKELHARGLRFRVDRPVLGSVRRRPDIIFSGPKVAVYVDGCFWHACPLHGTWPKANASFWREKLEANRERDRSTDCLMSEAGWYVERVWEHECPSEAADRIQEAIDRRRSSP
jgi:DNA mismatch endonuclease (patch repair protein)